MKEQYQFAEMEVVTFVTEDIINTSDEATTTLNSKCPTESPTGDAWV